MNGKILVIDDDEVDQLVIRKFLAKAGYDKVLVAADGEKGLDIVKAERPNLVIVDTLLPGMNGPETCRQIKELPGGHAKVILTTGAVDAVNAGNARKAGADDYVVKTFDFSFLVEAVKKIIGENNE